MSTHATIAIELIGGLVIQQYVNFDGYVDGVGFNLYKYWKNDLAVIDLIANYGEIRSLGPTLATSNFYYPDMEDVKAEPICFDRFKDWIIGKGYNSQFTTLYDTKRQYNYIMRKNSRYDWYYTIGSKKNLNLLKFPDDVV